MIERFYLRLYDRASRRPWIPLAALALLALVTLPQLAGVRLDMSFRPLFADEADLAEATRDFEGVFGQASGSQIGVIIERSDVLSATFYRELWELSANVERLHGVAEVTSLARLPLLDWSGPEPRGAWAIPAAALHPSAAAELEARIRALASDERVRRVLISENGSRALLLARLDLPLDDLSGRGEVIDRFRAVVSERLGVTAHVHYVGVSVVEQSYAAIVLSSLARSFVLTTLSVLLVLGFLFRRVGAVAVVMAGVTAALPISLGILTSLGQDITMVNSIVPVMIMIIGVADGIHMLESFFGRMRSGEHRAGAIRGMFGDMAVPCLLTTATTTLGFLALHTARITAIRDFGLNVAIGVTVIYLVNLLLVPMLLHAFPDSMLIRRHGTAVRGAWAGAAGRHVLERPGSILLLCAVGFLGAAVAVPRLQIDQRFNQEVGARDPVRAGQALLEREFGGILGPEISIRRRDGATLLEEESLRRVAAFHRAAQATPGVLNVSSVADFLPSGQEPAAPGALERLRRDALLGSRYREAVAEAGTRMAVSVRTGDIGTRAAIQLGTELETLAGRHLGPDYEARVVGQWWLAQRGMDNVLRDMLTSFAASCLLVLPILAFAVRRARLVLIAAIPNLLPMLFAVGFMSAAGISLRIGTAMVLAIALGVAIDDGIHLLLRLRTEEGRHSSPAAAVEATLASTGRAIAATTLVLVLGFLSMLSNDLLAIRDMGLVAAVTLVVALLANFFVAPALYVLTAPRARLAPSFTTRHIPMPETRT